MRRTPAPTTSTTQTTPGATAPRGPRRLVHYLRRLRRERRAVVAIEFAMIVGPLLALLLVSLQIPLIFFADEALQGAATMAGRQVMTGQVQQTGMTQAAFQKAVCNLLTGLFSCSNVMVDVESADNFDGISTTPPTETYGSDGMSNNKWAFSPGGPDDVVIVRVMYNWPVVASALIPGLANQPGGARLLIGTAVFKNEPFP